MRSPSLPLPHPSLLEEVEREMYEDFYRAVPPELAHRRGIRMIPGILPFERPAGSGEVNGPLHLLARGFDHPMFNRTLGILERAPEVLEAARALFPAEGVRRWMLQVPPGAENGEFREAARLAGLVRHRGWAKHVAPPGATAPPPAADLRIRRIDPAGTPEAPEVPEGEAAAWARIVTECFSMPEDFQPWLAALSLRPRWHLYLALDGDEPVAAASLFQSARHPEVAQLNFAGTRPGHRGRGAQPALVTRRRVDARELGAQWIATETDEDLPDRPNPSYRNMVRLGLPVLYVRANWGPPKPVVS
jgi:hypothetical protein